MPLQHKVFNLFQMEDPCFLRSITNPLILIVLYNKLAIIITLTVHTYVVSIFVCCTYVLFLHVEFFVAIRVAFNPSTYTVEEDVGTFSPVLTLNRPSPCCITVFAELINSTAIGEHCTIIQVFSCKDKRSCLHIVAIKFIFRFSVCMLK